MLLSEPGGHVKEHSGDWLSRWRVDYAFLVLLVADMHDVRNMRSLLLLQLHPPNMTLVELIIEETLGLFP